MGRRLYKGWFIPSFKITIMTIDFPCFEYYKLNIQPSTLHHPNMHCPLKSLSESLFLSHFKSFKNLYSPLINCINMYSGCLLCLAGSMISGAGAAVRAIGEKPDQLEKPDTHAMATYIKRLMKRDGQEVSAVDPTDQNIYVYYILGLGQRGAGLG